MMDLDGFLAALDGLAVQTDPVVIKRKSRDFYWYSPVLKRQLDSRFGDVVVMPRDEPELLRLAASALAHRVPLTTRGGGTGNYGQAVPLEGGAIVDMGAFDKLLWVRDGIARVQAGMNLLALDRQLRAQGWEIRLYPSTKRTASIGGFVSGGSGGIGSVTWGGLRDRGNLLAVRVVSLQDPPMAIELRGDATDAVNHTYGTTGIVTELEIPVQPAVAWREAAYSFPDFPAAARFGLALASQFGIEKKLSTVTDAGLTPYFAPLRDLVPQDRPLALAIVAPSGLDAATSLAKEQGGTLCFEGALAEAEDDPARTPLYELTWNHTTLQVLKRDRGFTYLQCLFPPDDTLARVEAIRALFGDELMMHLEFLPTNFQCRSGRMTCSGLPVLRYSTEERLDEIIRLHEERGVLIANPHVYTIEDGGLHRVASPELAAVKQHMDPAGLLNPGKMRSFTRPAA